MEIWNNLLPFNLFEMEGAKNCIISTFENSDFNLENIK